MDNVDQFAATLRGVLDLVGTEGALFSKVEARRQQEVVRFLRWDRVNWWRWLTGIAVEHDCDLATIMALPWSTVASVPGGCGPRRLKWEATR